MTSVRLSLSCPLNQRKLLPPSLRRLFFRFFDFAPQITPPKAKGSKALEMPHCFSIKLGIDCCSKEGSDAPFRWVTGTSSVQEYSVKQFCCVSIFFFNV